MNIVNRSIEMKNPNTPVDRRISQRKKSLGSGSIFHDAKVPAKHDNRRKQNHRHGNSVDTEGKMDVERLKPHPRPGVEHRASAPSWRRCRKSKSRYTERATSAVEPMTATVRTCLMSRQRNSSPSITSGMTTKYIRIFENIIITIFFRVFSHQ